DGARREARSRGVLPPRARAALTVPELPEVETVVRGLAPELVGRRVVAVEVRERRLRGGVAATFAARLRGRTVTGLGRRGKYLVATLDDGRLWLVHLGMTGRLTLSAGDVAAEVHDHVVVRLDDGRLLTYNDARRFGRLAVIAASALAAAPGAGAAITARQTRSAHVRTPATL